MNISYLLKYLLKRKWLVLIPTLVAIFLAWWLSRHQSAEYTSVAELSTGYMDVNPLNNSSRSQNNTVLFNNVIQTLKSNQVLDQVSYSLLLHDIQGNAPFYPKASSNASGIISNYPGGKNGLLISLTNKLDSFYVLDLARNDDRMIRELADIYGYSPDALLKQTKISRVENSDFITVTATSENARLSALIANEICRRFLILYQNKVGRSSASSLDSLKSMTENKKQILDAKLQLLQDGGDLALSGSVGLLGSLQTQVTQQKSNLIAAQVALQNTNQQIAKATKKGGLANNEDIIALRTNIDNLYAKYVNSGSNDANLLTQIDQLRTTLQQKLSSMGGDATGVPLSDLMKQKTDLEVKIDVAKQTMKDIEGKINLLQGTVQSSAAKQGVVQGIQSEIEIARQQYEAANSLYNEALNRNMFPGNDFKQVLQASPPLYPSPSQKAKIIGFAGTGVFFFTIFLLLFFEFIDPSIKTPSYLKANVPFPILANFRLINSKVPPLEYVLNNSNPPSDSHISFKEQVKQLRYEVEHSRKKIFLVASYNEASGKTTIIEALAASLSLSKRQILIIDANFHNNTLTRKFNATASLETFVASTHQSEANLAIDTQATYVNGNKIGIIGCSSGDYTPTEVLPEKNVFTNLRQNDNYDYVLVDCASLSRGPDCKELLKYVDAVILAYAADQPFTEEDRAFVNFLGKNNIAVLGAVLNRVPVYSLDL